MAIRKSAMNKVYLILRLVLGRQLRPLLLILNREGLPFLADDAGNLRDFELWVLGPTLVPDAVAEQQERRQGFLGRVGI